MIRGTLRHFIGKRQAAALVGALMGEENEHFKKLLQDLKATIETMPKTYETDGMGDKAPVTLHYFLGGSDWWIIEKDMKEEQLQAFGYVCLNGWKDFAELGYISIEELITVGAELDLHWIVKTIGEIKKELHGIEELKESCTG